MDAREPPDQPHHRRGALAAAAVLASALVAALVVGSILGGAAPVAAPPGIPDAGTWTGWALRLAETAALAAAVLTLGSLLVAGFLLDPGEASDEKAGAVSRRATRAAARTAGVWSVASVATAVLVVAEARAVPVTRLLGGLLGGAEPWRATVAGTPATARGHLIGAVVAGLVAVLASRARTRRAAGLASGVVLLGLLPPQLAGHAVGGADQDVVATGIVVHVTAAAVWVGGLVGLLVHLRREPALRASAVGRFSPVAGAAYLALAVSGAAAASVRLSTWSAWSSGYGALVLAKVALLVGLGWCGHLHRRRLQRAATYGARAVFVRLALAEVALMAVAAGFAVALSRTPLPVVQAAPVHGTGHPGLPAVVEPVTAVLLVGAVRPNALALLVVGGLLAAYRTAVRRVVASGGTWPAARMHAATAAALLAVVVLCSGLATYAPAMLSVQVGQLLAAMLVVPAVAVRAAPVELWRRTRTPWAEAADAPVGPVVGAVAVGALLVLVYRTPLLELSQRSHWVHLGLLLAAAVAGLLHLAALLPLVAGSGAGAQLPRPAGSSLLPLGVPTLCLAVLGVQLLTSDRLVAGRWFLELRWGWVDPAADQRLAGMLALAAAGLLATLVALAVLRGGRSAQPDGGGQSLSSTRPSRASAGTAP